MVIFHKYILIKQAFQSEFDLEIACISALFLATKICNFLVSLSRIIQNYIVLNKSLSNKNIEILNNSSTIHNHVVEIEVEMLDCIGFDINVDLPYPYIERMKPYLNKIISDQKLIKIIYNFLNDSFKLPIILNFSPLKIALACVYLLSVHFKVELKSILIDKDYNIVRCLTGEESKSGGCGSSQRLDEIENKEENSNSNSNNSNNIVIPWYKYLSSDVELEEIIEISSVINILYVELKKIKILKSEKNNNTNKINCDYLKSEEDLSLYINFESEEKKENNIIDVNKKYPILGFDFLKKKRNSSAYDFNFNKNLKEIENKEESNNENESYFFCKGLSSTTASENIAIKRVEIGKQINYNINSKVVKNNKNNNKDLTENICLELNE